MGLNIIACVKSVFNNMLPGSNRSTSENMELNPFDRPAIEMALSLIKEHEGTLTVISMGPKPATFGLYQAIAMGADRGILICDPALKESDTYITAKVLGRALERLQPFDIVLFGTRSSDSDTGHVGPQTAQMLNIPFVGNIHLLTIKSVGQEIASDLNKGTDPSYANATPNSNHSCAEATPNSSETAKFLPAKNHWTVERKADGYLETFEIQAQKGTGAAFTVNPAFGESEFTSLHGIETAFTNKNIELWDNSTLGLKPEETGLAASPTKIVAWNKEKRSKRCLFIDGTPEQKAEQLAQKLSEAGFVG